MVLENSEIYPPFRTTAQRRRRLTASSIYTHRARVFGGLLRFWPSIIWLTELSRNLPCLCLDRLHYYVLAELNAWCPVCSMLRDSVQWRSGRDKGRLVVVFQYQYRLVQSKERGLHTTYPSGRHVTQYPQPDISVRNDHPATSRVIVTLQHHTPSTPTCHIYTVDPSRSPESPSMIFGDSVYLYGWQTSNSIKQNALLFTHTVPQQVGCKMMACINREGTPKYR